MGMDLTLKPVKSMPLAVQFSHHLPLLPSVGSSTWMMMRKKKKTQATSHVKADARLGQGARWGPAIGVKHSY